MTEGEKDMLALALGRMLLQYGETLDREDLAKKIGSDAERCLLDISGILDRKELSDFQCVEEIAVRLEQVGLGTWRHDFG